jgi:hypothetical protein
MRNLWRAELHRVEEILDARLKHISGMSVAGFGSVGPAPG